MPVDLGPELKLDTNVPTTYNEKHITASHSDLPEPNIKKIVEKYEEEEKGMQLGGKDYGDALGSWVVCMSEYFNTYNTVEILKPQLNRTDLDTVCGIELRNLKKGVLDHDILEVKQWIQDKSNIQ